MSVVIPAGRGSPEEDDDRPQQFKLLPLLVDFVRNRLYSSFEWTFVVATFLGIALILWLVQQKLSFLNFYFIPVLLAGCFLNARSAVLGSILAILVVTFCVVLHPDSFYQELTRMGLYLHLIAWGSFLILTGAIVGTLAERLRSQFLKASNTLLRLVDDKEEEARAYRQLSERSQALEAEKMRIEAVLNATMDPLVARLIIARQLKSERRQISVLAAEAADAASRASAEPPEDMVRGLNRLYGAIEPLLVHYKGHLDRYTGCGLLAEFGVPFPLRRHMLLAALAGFKVQQRIASENIPWKLRIGVSSGECLLGLIGSGSRRNYTAVGPAVEEALRLRAVCPAGSVAVDEAVAGEVRRWFQMRLIQARAAVRLSFCDSTANRVAVDQGSRGAAYELIGLKDPLDDTTRVPPAAGRMYLELSHRAALPLKAISLIEALEGSLGHAKVTASLAAAAGNAAGLDERQVRTLFMAACMHDAGKCGLPEDLLWRQEETGALSEPERDLLRAHPAMAEQVIDQIGIPVNQDILDIVRQHHERFDGSGYPEGLKGAQICLGARILQLADSYERLSGGLGAREPMPAEDALNEIRRDMAEGRLDPKLGGIFLKLF
ncbi:MAG: HD domain-containing protein [Elusimicrobia bacterium]|nr:HD domain-containing protein [Elusimicrobiota bacterium]